MSKKKKERSKIAVDYLQFSASHLRLLRLEFPYLKEQCFT